MYTRHSQRGVSLIELIMFIVIVSVALAGILGVMNIVTRNSADPLIHKQSLAIAESMLEEIELMPFTFCDPDDANATTATVAAVAANGCAATVEGMGPEPGEVRGGAAPFDNVNDYHGFGMAAGAILDIGGNNTGLNGYTLNPILIAQVGNALGLALDADALRISVTVTGPDGLPVIVDGVRTRYAPNAVP